MSQQMRFYGTKTTYTIAKRTYHNSSFNSKIANCKPIMLYFIGRHAIRYPDAEDIEEMSQFLPSLQHSIMVASRKGLTELCDKDIEAIRDWKLRMVKSDDNRISDTGAAETKTIAKGFKERFPSLLDPNKAKIEIGITKKERTLQTAYAFLEQIYKDYKDTSQENDHVKDKSDDDNKGPISLVPKVEPFLFFHSTCKKLLLDQGVKFTKPKPVIDLRSGELMNKLLNRINRRFGLSDDSNIINLETLRHIIRACHFEYAINGESQSPWCSAFGDAELKVLEYLDDFEDFYEDAYGRDINNKQTCPLIGDLYEKVKLSVMSHKEKKTYLHFTHAGVMKRLYSGFGLFNDLNTGSTLLSSDEEICHNNGSTLLSSNEEISHNNERKWRSSLISPFSANFAAVLYKCNNKEENNKKNGKYAFKLLTLVQENPVLIHGCDSELCSLEKFMDAYQSMATNCNLQEICRI